LYESSVVLGAREGKRRKGPIRPGEILQKTSKGLPGTAIWDRQAKTGREKAVDNILPCLNPGGTEDGRTLDLRPKAVFHTKKGNLSVSHKKRKGWETHGNRPGMAPREKVSKPLFRTENATTPGKLGVTPREGRLGRVLPINNKRAQEEPMKSKKNL